MENTTNNCNGRPQAHFHIILPFLAIPLAIGLAKGIMHHRFAHTAEGRHEGWKNGVPPMFAEFHRRAHAAEAPTPVEAQQ